MAAAPDTSGDRWERPGSRKPPDSPAHTPRDERDGAAAAAAAAAVSWRRRDGRSWSSGDFRPPAKLFGKNGVLEEQKSPRIKRRETQVYVGNLPLDISEEEIRCLLKDFNPLHVHKIQNGCKCFAFVDLGSMQNVELAIQKLNGKLFHKRKLYVNANKRSSRRTQDVAGRPQELPVLEASGAGFAEATACTQLTSKAAGGLGKAEKPRTPFFAVPMEMRGSFLVQLLRECFQDLHWLATVNRVAGEVGLLVTSVVPQTPFFWAMHVTEALHQNMQALFSTLAAAEEQQPYLQDAAAQRGARCLAEHHLGPYGHAWNRCWVLDRVDTWAVVMFIDFGQSATVPVRSLRSLNSDAFWTIPPLTQPFMLEKDILSSHQITHRILKGKITGTLNLEPHILKFEEFK
ncbi:PREDICTED: tudor domain-containing protein 10 [Condylura cristata]|uniref:tudor domain-containing protein 10 n=1 Tax=Condylura cristata TaxID=143302 RepID=UPI0003346859|nr:PREDICTED: tudor domain-containing protein 10 [Condylura cristata]